LGFVIASVAPIFGLILLGLAAARLRWVSDFAGKGVTEFTFIIAMPALLFRSIVKADLGQTEPLLLLAAYFATVGVTWAIATLASAALLRRTPAEGAVFAMTASYGNIVLLGIPIALSAFGEQVAPTAAIVVSMHVATLWLAACFHLALVERQRTESLLQLLRSVVVEFSRNPIVVAIVVGALWRATGFGLDASIDRALAMLAQAGVPCALFAVGFGLRAFRLGGEASALLVSLALKNLVMPVLAWVLTIHVFGLSPLPAIVITLFAAMPTGTATYLFASRYGLATETTSASVALSTGVSMVTLPIALLLLGQP
jgi:predicted permease